ncbi:MAG TPA: membrane protein insertase YidC [Steroidobacteraceae bacterium]|jgi:YidC/Oxa1 family membrane protein insertase|nr:membrane protein insertase YidC [Steroidobacteraceae bacterium]
MDNQRVFIWAALALVLYLNYMAWQRDYAPQAAPVTATTQTQSATPNTPPPDTLPELPSDTANATAPQAKAAPAPGQAVETSETSAGVVRVVTDVLSIDISKRGGDLERADLLKYAQVKNRPDLPVRLFNPQDPRYVAQSGLRAADKRPEPNHLALYHAAADEYRMQAGASKLVVPLTWSEDGITVTKTYTFYPGTYRIDLSYDVVNTSSGDWKAASYVQIVRHYEHVERSYFKVETYAYRGPAISDGKGYRRLNVEKDEDRTFKANIQNGWIAALQHHFVTAAVPPAPETAQFQLGLNARNDFTLSYIGPAKVVPAGGTQTFQEKLFVGPKLQDQLKATAPLLDHVTDYGWLTPIAQPLFWLLEKVYDLVRNWGAAIIIVTFLIKLAFYKLTAASGRSMAKMRNVAPRIKAIQERYKDDREQLGRQMMELYKREKINPLAGCLPILIQIPFFFAFYRVLLESVEMRQAPFLGWINDLSSRDPFFILPLMMGAAMFAQFKLQPMPSTDPMQAKVFQFMPVIMSVTMAWFPAGLVLYWLTNTLLSIAQQYRINKLVAAEQQKT